MTTTVSSSLPRLEKLIIILRYQFGIMGSSVSLIENHVADLNTELENGFSQMVQKFQSKVEELRHSIETEVLMMEQST